MNLNDQAKTLFAATEALAQCQRQKVSGIHVLYCAFRQPFPALANALVQEGVSADTLLGLAEPILARADVPPDRPFIEAIGGTDPSAEIGPEALFAAAFSQQTDPVHAFRRELKDFPSLQGRLETIAAPRAAPDTELRIERVSGRMAALLGRAQSSAKGRPTGTRHLLRVWLSDHGSLLSKGLFAVNGYEPLLAELGGKAEPATDRQTAVDLEKCAEYLRFLLQAALVKAMENGGRLIDERSLALAFLEGAESDPNSDFAPIARAVQRLRGWIASQPDEATEASASGIIPIEEIVPFLESRLINQNHAIAEVYRPILRVRLDLGFQDALAAVLLFVGPPGVGKTYLAKLMAEVLYGHDPEKPEAHVVIIECGRYKDSHAVTDLIGAPHGYVGSDKGILRDGVRDKYPCVIAFDEAERMNPAIWDALLTLMNDGVFRDNEGARYTLKDCVIVLTSNKGLDEAEDYRRKVSFGEFEKAEQIIKEADSRLGDPNRSSGAKGPRQVMSADAFWDNPEYRENYKAILLSRVREHFGEALYSRIDAKIGFNGLRGEDYVKIANNAIRALTDHLKSRTAVTLWPGVGVAEAVANLVRSQFSADARAVSRVVRKTILDDAFAPLKLQHMREGKPLEAAYEIRPVLSGRGEARLLQRFELVPGDPPHAEGA